MVIPRSRGTTANGRSNAAFADQPRRSATGRAVQLAIDSDPDFSKRAPSRQGMHPSLCSGQGLGRGNGDRIAATLPRALAHRRARLGASTIGRWLGGLALAGLLAGCASPGTVPSARRPGRVAERCNDPARGSSRRCQIQTRLTDLAAVDPVTQRRRRRAIAGDA